MVNSVQVSVKKLNGRNSSHLNSLTCINKSQSRQFIFRLNLRYEIFNLMSEAFEAPQGLLGYKVSSLKRLFELLITRLRQKEDNVFRGYVF